eukprot:TRINITY_DN8971_c0_g1_i2.p2 TRINITY_DN8971_c0_g1~~TRINITY_DN8971_c0_g1_i2.p2  ORF type:complete len:164 (-),score=15.99 TRINITY_DN8971_c0_g1_i2:4-495(-)
MYRCHKHSAYIVNRFRIRYQQGATPLLEVCAMQWSPLDTAVCSLCSQTSDVARRYAPLSATEVVCLPSLRRRPGERWLDAKGTAINCRGVAPSVSQRPLTTNVAASTNSKVANPEPAIVATGAPLSAGGSMVAVVSGKETDEGGGAVGVATGAGAGAMRGSID